MEHIKNTLANKGKKTAATERGELMKYFLERLNPSRVRDGYPPLSLPRMGRVLQAIPTKDLYFLKSVCRDAESKSTSKDAFAKKFWWEIKPKPDATEAGRVPTKASGKHTHE